MNTCTGNCNQGRTCTCDPARVERQRFLHPEAEATMPVRTFYGWLFMAFCYGFVAAVVLGIALGFV